MVEHTIACNDKKLVIVVNVVLVYVWEGCNNLLLWWKLWALLELEVADCARKCEVAIDAAKVDEATSGGDTSFLGYHKFSTSAVTDVS